VRLKPSKETNGPKEEEWMHGIHNNMIPFTTKHNFFQSLCNLFSRVFYQSSRVEMRCDVSTEEEKNHDHCFRIPCHPLRRRVMLILTLKAISSSLECIYPESNVLYKFLHKSIRHQHRDPFAPISVIIITIIRE